MRKNEIVDEKLKNITGTNSIDKGIAINLNSQKRRKNVIVIDEK